MPALVVPGVRVEARFDVLPPLPAPSGIVGVVGIVDRLPQTVGLIGVTKTAEIRDLLGPGTLASMPEVVHALANGASEAVISPVEGGASASATLANQNSEGVVMLRCRSAGAAGNALRAEVRTVRAADNSIARVTLRLLRSGQTVETFADMRIEPGAPDDLFETVNRQSTYVVAVDPGFVEIRPAPGTYSFSDTRQSDHRSRGTAGYAQPAAAAAGRRRRPHRSQRPHRRLRPDAHRDGGSARPAGGVHRPGHGS